MGTKTLDSQEAILNSLVQYLRKDISKRGLDFISKYSTDVNLISEYSKSFRLREIYKDQLFVEDDLKYLKDKQKNKDAIVLLYNRSPLQRYDGAFGNQKFTTSTSTRPAPLIEGQKIVDNDFSEYLSELKDFTDNEVILDLFVGKMDVNFNFITNSTYSVNKLEFMYMRDWFQRPKSMTVIFKPNPNVEPLELTYNIYPNEITAFGQIDYRTYGDLNQMSFSMEVKGVFTDFTMQKPEELLVEASFEIGTV